MLGLRRLSNATARISSVELVHRMYKGQFNLARVEFKDAAAPTIWDAVLAIQ